MGLGSLLLMPNGVFISKLHYIDFSLIMQIASSGVDPGFLERRGGGGYGGLAMLILYLKMGGGEGGSSEPPEPPRDLSIALSLRDGTIPFASSLDTDQARMLCLYPNCLPL